MNKGLCAVLVGVLLGTGQFACGIPWNEEAVVQAEGDMTFAPTIYENVTMTFDGQTASEGDAVAVFREGSAGTVFCGYGEVYQSKLDIVLYAAKDTPLTLKVWRKGTPDTEVLFPASIALDGEKVDSLLAPNPGWSGSGLSVLIELSPVSQSYSLHETPSYGNLPTTYKGGTFNGYAVDTEGNVAGTYVLSVKKPKKGSSSAAATLTFTTLATGKKMKVNGTVNLVTGEGGGALSGLKFGANAVGGSVAKVGTLEGGADAAKAKDKAALSVLSKFSGKGYVLAFGSAAPQGYAQGGYSTLAITMAAKGKAKVSGVLADGTKVTASAQMTVGDEYCCVPVAYAKKSKFGFVVWFDKNTRELVAVTAATPWKNTVKPSFTMAWEVAASGMKNNLAAGTRTVALDGAKLSALVPGAIEQTPVSIPLTVKGTKWNAGKAAKVAYKGGVSVSGSNVSGLKLTYTAKTGLFKGSFTVYSVKGGKLAKNKFSVFGAVTGGVGYGTAVLKGKGSASVVIE